MNIKILGNYNDLFKLKKEKALIINALKPPPGKPMCNIKGTTPHGSKLDKKLKEKKYNRKVIVYCANSTCGAAMYYIEKNLKKYKNVYYYKPGMYEYMLLRRAYGSDKFPIDGKCTSIKRFQHFTLERKYKKN